MELAIVISYPTNVSGTIGILKTSPKHSKLNIKKINFKTTQKITHHVMASACYKPWLIYYNG